MTPFSDKVALLVDVPPFNVNDVPLSIFKVSPKSIPKVPTDALVFRLTTEFRGFPPSMSALLEAALGNPETLQLESVQLPVPPCQV